MQSLTQSLNQTTAQKLQVVKESNQGLLGRYTRRQSFERTASEQGTIRSVNQSNQGQKKSAWTTQKTPHILTSKKTSAISLLTVYIIKAKI